LCVESAVDLAAGVWAARPQTRPSVIFVMAEALEHEILDLAREGVVTGALADDEGLPTWPRREHTARDWASRFNARRIAKGSISSISTGDHRPDGREDDDVRGKPAVVEISRPRTSRPRSLVAIQTVAQPDLEARPSRRGARLADDHGTRLTARNGLAQRSRLTTKSTAPRISWPGMTPIAVGAYMLALRMANVASTRMPLYPVDRIAR